MNTKLRGLLINLSLIVISSILTLVVSEIALRLFGFEPLYVSPERDQFWKYDSRLGWAHAPGQDGIFETQQFRTTVHINEKGLRDRPHSYERQSDIKRILVLGDSFAWGYGVEESERFSQRLEEAMGVEVINAGVSGYSTDQELLWYENEGVKYETDLVILVVAGNDVGDNERRLVSTIYYKPKFILEDGKPVLTGSPVPQTSTRGKFVYAVSQRSALAYFLVQRYFDGLSLYAKWKNKSEETSSPAPAATVQRQPFQLTIALIDEMRTIAESRNARFMIVSTDRWWNYQSEETYQDFVAILQSKGFLILDVESMPGFDPADMVIADDGHWNSKGHAFVSEQIKKFIESHALMTSPLSR